jgi:hypothetical protein
MFHEWCYNDSDVFSEMFFNISRASRATTILWIWDFHYPFYSCRTWRTWNTSKTKNTVTIRRFPQIRDMKKKPKIFFEKNVGIRVTSLIEHNCTRNNAKKSTFVTFFLYRA